MVRRALAALALLSGCTGGGTPALPPLAPPCSAASAVATTVVAMVADTMNPDCIQVPRGASVEFLNQDPEMHTATTESGTPAFDLLVPAGTSASTPPLDVPGTIVASCTFHPAMRVTILVP
jgi:plastocyanin